ncbi:MAG: VUT family protein [Alphaproteobacteria bacterium]|nr:VUT family protein [Alphaproteobacteria bacterium]
MSNTINDLYADENWRPKYLHIVGICLGASILITNVLATKVIEIGPLTFGSGTLIFPFCLILGDIITEVYGFKRARQLIITTLLCFFFYALMSQIVIALPHSAAWQHQAAYETIFSIALRSFIAGSLAYLTGELTNSWIMSRMKTLTHRNSFYTRALVSTIVAELTNTAVFIPITFGSTLPIEVIVKMVLIGTSIKIVMEALILPFTGWIVKKLKALEGVDYFDQK